MPADDEDDWLASRSCLKIPYLRRKEARRDCRRRTGVGTGHMRAYRCWYCPYWHVGHLPAMVREGALTASQFYYYAMRGEIPLPGQRPIDMTEGIMRPREVANAFRVNDQTVYAWARAYQANNPDSSDAQLAAVHTPGGHWRFSTKAVREALERVEHG